MIAELIHKNLNRKNILPRSGVRNKNYEIKPFVTGAPGTKLKGLRKQLSEIGIVTQIK